VEPSDAQEEQAMAGKDDPGAEPEFLMLTLEDFAGTGVAAAEGDKIAVAFTTVGGPSFDITMTKEQARELAANLMKAAT
jgi:hypothetical protein